MRSLSVGNVAPEIEGEDIGGEPMKLSDYRGKVVVLVFWAIWCGPCMGMIPHEKDLVERHKGQPFALLGINSDTDREKLKATIAENGITWRSWWDQGKAPRADRDPLGCLQVAQCRRPGREGGDPVQDTPSFGPAVARRCGRFPLEGDGAVRTRPILKRGDS